MPFRHIASIRKRASGLVDLLIDDQESNPSFTLSFCQELQGSYINAVTIPQYIGGRSSSVPMPTGYEGSDIKNKTRYVFDPADVGMDDESVFWVLITVNGGPAAGTQLSYPVIIATHSDRASFVVSGSCTTGGVEVLLPSQSDSIYIQNTKLTPDIYVKYEPNGSEFLIPPIGSNEPPLYPERYVSRIFLRGDGATGYFTLKANLRLYL